MRRNRIPESPSNYNKMLNRNDHLGKPTAPEVNTKPAGCKMRVFRFRYADRRIAEHRFCSNTGLGQRKPKLTAITG
jgi:hypothetical protein